MNNYEELKCIGNGSFGQVYLVKSKQDGLKYAIKSINIVDIKEKDRKNMENEVNFVLKC
jgi:serine/threonine protein kinase